MGGNWNTWKLESDVRQIVALWGALLARSAGDSGWRLAVAMVKRERGGNGKRRLVRLGQRGESSKWEFWNLDAGSQMERKKGLSEIVKLPQRVELGETEILGSWNLK